MDTWERQKVVEIAIDQVKDRLPVIVHVGAISTKTTVELARHAYECGDRRYHQYHPSTIDLALTRSTTIIRTYLMLCPFLDYIQHCCYNRG